MIKHRVAAALVAMGMGVSLMTGAAAPPAPTPVSEADIAAGIACANAVDVGFTIRSGYKVKGQGSWTKCNDSVNRIEMKLRYSRPIGPYTMQQYTANPANFGSFTVNLEAVCSGSGTRTWFVDVFAYNAAGTLTASKRSNLLTTNC